MYWNYFVSMRELEPVIGFVRSWEMECMSLAPLLSIRLAGSELKDAILPLSKGSLWPQETPCVLRPAQTVAL